MARWKLTEAHYLKVPGTKWELTRQDRATGRPTRIVYEVPRYLHPEDPDDWNYGDKRSGDGYIIVCHEGKGLPEDITFLGDPTPGMLPFDDEAKEITAKFKDKWTPTQGTDEISQSNSFQQKMLLGFLDQMSVTNAAAASAPMAPGFDKFMETMMAMMAQQGQILAALANKAIVNDAPPLEEVEPTEEELEQATAIAQAKETESVAKAQAHAQRRRV